jgi:hypothetical protein
MTAVALDACGAHSELVGKFTCAICLGVLVRLRSCQAARARGSLQTRALPRLPSRLTRAA